jgi:hypothetical protein
MSIHCRSCGAEIIWAKTKSGKAMPIDAKPSPNGNLVLRKLAGGRDCHVGIFAVGPDAPHVEPRYVSHFSTCPQANKHRKSKAQP